MNFGETYHYTPEEEQRLDELVDTGVATYADARDILGIQPDALSRPAWVDEIAASIPLGGAAEVAVDPRPWSPTDVLATLPDDERLLPDWGKLAAGDKD